MTAFRLSKKAKAWLVDTGERAGSTFAEAFVAVFGLQGLTALAGGDWHGAGALARSAAAAAAATALAVLKSALAAKARNTVSPASLAPAQQPGQAEQDAPPPTRRRRQRA